MGFLPRSKGHGVRHTLVSRIAEGLSPMGFVEVENHSFELLRHLEPNVYRIEKAHTVILATRELCQKKACPVEINGWRGGGGPGRRGRLPRTTHHAHRVPAPPWGRGGCGALLGRRQAHRCDRRRWLRCRTWPT